MDPQRKRKLRSDSKSQTKTSHSEETTSELGEPKWKKLKKQQKSKILKLKDLKEELRYKFVNVEATVINSRELPNVWRAVITDGQHATYVCCFNEVVYPQFLKNRKYKFAKVEVRRVNQKFQVHGYLKYELVFRQGSKWELVDEEEFDRLPSSVYTKLDKLPTLKEDFVSIKVVVKQKYPPKFLEYSSRWCQMFLVCDNSSLEVAIELFGDDEHFGDQFPEDNVLILDGVHIFDVWHKIWLKFSQVSLCKDEKLLKWYYRNGDRTRLLYEKLDPTTVDGVDKCSKDFPLVRVHAEMRNVKRLTYLGCPKINCRRKVGVNSHCRFCQHEVDCEPITYITFQTFGSEQVITYFLHESDEQNVENYSCKMANIIVDWNDGKLNAVTIDISHKRKKTSRNNNNNNNNNSEVDDESQLLFPDFMKVMYDGPATLDDLIATMTNRKRPRKKSVGYPMNNKPHGEVLIINNKLFTDKKLNRDGTEYDEHNLRMLFTKLGFTLRIERDKSAKGILDIINEVRSRDHSRYDALFVIILSHGSEGVIDGTDNISVSIEDIIQSFDGNKCPSLAGKPKVFFTQACHGDLNSYRQPRSLRSSDRVENCKADVMGDASKSFAGKPGGQQTKHEKSDILLVNSSVKGYESWLYAERGSCFIRTLVYVIAKCAHKQSLSWMLTKVKYLMTKLRVTDADNKQINLLGEDRVNTMRKEMHFYAE